jgi:TolB-like protein
VEVDTQREVSSILAEINEKTTITNLSTEFIKDKSHGLISSYEVLDCNPTGGAGHWTARVVAHIAIYKPIGTDRSNERSILILPFPIQEVKQTEVNLGDSRDLSRQLQQQLISEFTQARKFRVISDEPEIEAELGRIRAGQTSPEQQVKLGQRLGADYILSGTVTLLEINTWEQEPVGKGSLAGAATVNIDFQVIEVAPHEVRWADTTSANYGTDMLKSMNLLGNPQATRQQLFRDGADLLATDVLDAIYPVKVLTVEEDGRIILNQGGRRLREGALLNLFDKIQTYADPDTGLPIRVEGRKLGTVQVAEVQPKCSAGRLTEGDITRIQPGVICRRAGQQEIVAAERAWVEQQRAETAKLLAAGKCPPLEIQAHRLAAGWGFVLRNLGEKELEITGMTRVVGGARSTSSYPARLAKGQSTTFNLSDWFNPLDQVEIICTGFEKACPYVFCR